MDEDEFEDNGKGDEEMRNHLPFESDFIFMVVARTLFGPRKLGLKYPARFAPVPIRFLAFLCSVVGCLRYLLSIAY